MRRRTILGRALLLGVLAGGATFLLDTSQAEFMATCLADDYAIQSGGRPFCEGLWRHDLQLQRAAAGLVGLVAVILALLVAILAAFLDLSL